MSDKQPLVLIASSPIALLFAALYLVEDYLVDHCSKYLAALSELEHTISGGRIMIPTFDAAALDTFKTTTIPRRSVMSALAFVLPILGSIAVRLLTSPQTQELQYIRYGFCVVDLVILVLISIWFVRSYQFRTGENKIRQFVITEHSTAI